MDTVGRTTLTLTARNVVDEIRDRELIVTYEYPLLAGLRKPMILFASVTALFVAAWAIGSLDVGIAGRKVIKSS
jgi:oligosaccharyltransferase complex subunit alpha (ribophorin I)